MPAISANTTVNLADNDQAPIRVPTPSDDMFLQEADTQEEDKTLQQDENDAEVESADADDSASVCATIRYG